jgi:steroid delta-isomerase-like uncharacterized protein
MISRASILRALIVCACVGLANGGLASAQTGTPAASPMPLPPLIAEWETAMATRDPVSILALYADDAVWEEVPLGIALQGHAEIAAHLQQLFSATPDISYTVTAGFSTADQAVAEWVISGTLTGNFPGLPPGSGQSYSVRGVSLFQLVDGEIVRYTEYWDAYAFLVQLGALPAPATPAQ